MLNKKQPTHTMALGIMIAISLVIGVLGYIDYSQNEVISRAVVNIPIDMTAFQSTPTVSDVAGFQSSLAKYPDPSFISGSEFIEATSFLGRDTPGVIVHTNSTATGSTSLSSGGAFANLTNLINGTTAVLYGVNYSYFQTFSNVFRLTNGSATTFTNSTVFISSTFSDQTGIGQNDNMNLTIQSLNISGFQAFQNGNISVSLLDQGMFTVSGIVDINSVLFQSSSDSFTTPSSSSSSSTFGGNFFASRISRLSDVAIFMDINTFNSFVSSSAASFGAFQI